jgi:hypothetical protein
MGQLSGLWTKGVRRNCVWKDQFWTLVWSEVSRSYLTMPISSGGIAVCETAAVWSMAIGREDSTPIVLEP